MNKSTDFDACEIADDFFVNGFEIEQLASDHNLTQQSVESIIRLAGSARTVERWIEEYSEGDE